MHRAPPKIFTREAAPLRATFLKTRSPNRILYEIKGNSIDICAIIHKRRELLAEEIPAAR